MSEKALTAVIQCKRCLRSTAIRADFLAPLLDQHRKGDQAAVGAIDREWRLPRFSLCVEAVENYQVSAAGLPSSAIGRL
jgi:hypothetical protein